MAQISKRNKALSIAPLKASQSLGAALAFLGMKDAIPMLHGSQGCTAFGKVFFVRHFREPIPLQTTALDQVGVIMTPDQYALEGLKTLAEKSQPALIGLITTGLSETQGTDVRRIVSEFRATYPQFSATQVVAVNAPDFSGCLESGFAQAVHDMIAALVPETRQARARPRQVNVLAGAALTPSDVEVIKETLESFGLHPLIVPDISDALDGHLSDESFNPLTIGGAACAEFSRLGLAAATLVIGRSLNKAADLLEQRTGVPTYRFDTLMGIDAFDHFLTVLQEISARPVPEKFVRQRSQLQDAMLDSHFMLSGARLALACDPDEAAGFVALLNSMGAEVVALTVPAFAPILENLAVAEIKIGDLEDLETRAQELNAQVLIGNSHALASAQRLGIPLLRMGFPQYDYLGGYQRLWIGYRGARQALFDLANLITAHEHSITPYISIYKRETAYAPASAHCGH
jgi:nitrogenase molybdenum-iron protein NifN